MKLKLDGESLQIQDAAEKLSRILAFIALGLFALALAIIGSSHAH